MAEPSGEPIQHDGDSIESSASKESRGKFLGRLGVWITGAAALGLAGKAATEVPHVFDQALGRPEEWTDDDARAWLDRLEKDLREAQTVNEKDAIMSRLMAVDSAFPEFERYDAIKQQYTDLKQRWIDRHLGTSTTYMRYDEVYNVYEERMHRAILLAGPERLATFLKLSTLVVDPKAHDDAISYCIWRTYYLVDECERMAPPEFAKQLMVEIQKQLPQLPTETQHRIKAKLGNSDEAALYEEMQKLFLKYHIQ